MKTDRPLCPRPVLTLSLLAALLTVCAVAQAGPQAPRSAGAAMVVEFRATTAENQPITDLTPADVVVKVNGKARDLRALDVIQPKAKAGGPSRGPAPFATNVMTPDRRDVFVLIDDESIQAGSEHTAKAAIEQVIASLGPTDRVGALSVQGTGLGSGLTDRYGAVRTALAGFVGRGRNQEAAEDSACRTKRVLDAVMSLSGSFKPGGPAPTVLVFSTGLTPAGTQAMSKMGSNSVSGATGMCDIQPRDYQQTQMAMLDSAATFYVVDAADTAAQAGSVNPLFGGLENLSGLTGNRMIQPVRNGEKDIQRMIRETSAWYRATFEPEASEFTGSVVPVEVKVNRPGAQVTARPKTTIPKLAAKVGAVKDLLRDAEPHRDLELRAAAFVSRETGNKKLRVMVLFEATRPGVELKSAVVGLYDEKGKLLVNGSADGAALARTPPTIVVLADPGVYRMRVAAIDAGGNSGAVDTPVTVKLTEAGPLLVSSAIPGVAEAGGFAGRMTFSAEPLAVLYLELYNVAKTANVTATADVVESEDGPAIGQGSTRVAGDGSDDRRVILAGIPIGPFPAGDIVARITVSIDGKPVGRVIRTLRTVAK